MNLRAMRLKTGAVVMGLCLLLSTSDGAADDAQGWPRELQASGGTVSFYQPQPESLKGGRMTARVAVGVTLEGEADPIFGTVGRPLVPEPGTATLLAVALVGLARSYGRRPRSLA